MLTASGRVGRQLPIGAAMAPSVDLNMLGGSLDTRITFTRAAGSQSNFDSTGTMVFPGTNVARLDYDPSTARTNFLRNNTMVGAVAGTPGTTPTGWGGAFTPTNNLTSQVVGVGTVGGVPYIDMRLFGSTTGAGTFSNLALDTVAQIATINGQAWCASASIALVGGSLANVTMSIGAGIYDSASGYLGELPGRLTFVPTSTLTRVSAPGTIATVGVAFLNPYMQFAYAGGGGVSIDFTLRIVSPQLEQGLVATAVIPTASGAVTAGATARGLLIEEARTNSIRNNTAVGAVPGTPGTAPTNWNVTNNVAATVTLVGTGTEDGITYVDYRFFGTASGSGVIGLGFDTSTGIAALTAQLWAESVYYRLVGGSLTNLTNLQLGQDENTAIGTFVRQNAAVITAPTNAPLRTQRASLLSTLSGGATVAVLTPWLRFTVTGAGALDVTIRIGLPQLELGSFVTSAIPTSAGAATRAAETPLLPTAGSWFNALQGTIVVEAVTNGALASSPTVVGADTGNPNLGFGTDGRLSGAIRGVAAVLFGTGSVMTVGTINKFGWAYKSGGSIGAANGANATGGAAATAFSITGTKFELGSDGVTPGANALNGYIRRIRYWPRALSGAELIAATT